MKVLFGERRGATAQASRRAQGGRGLQLTRVWEREEQGGGNSFAWQHKVAAQGGNKKQKGSGEKGEEEVPVCLSINC